MKRSELKAAARKQLGGGIFQASWLMTLLALLIAGAIQGAAYVAAFVVVGPLSYGLARVMLNRVRHSDDNVQLGDLFNGFTECFGSSLVLGLLEGLFICLWTLLLIVPGIIKAYAYSMAFYIQQDSDNKNWKFCLDSSRKMMKGHKWELFVLDLSFLGWYILGMLCFGVGILFVEPYHEVTRANFYEELRKNTVEVA